MDKNAIVVSFKLLLSRKTEKKTNRFLSRNISVNEYLLGADENITRDGNDVSPKTGRRQDLRKGRDKNNLVEA